MQYYHTVDYNIAQWANSEWQLTYCNRTAKRPTHLASTEDEQEN